MCFCIVYLTLLAVELTREAGAQRIGRRAALGLSHDQRRLWLASDGVRLSGWYIASRNGAVIRARARRRR